MSIPKIVGIEQEYAISIYHDPNFNPTYASFLVVNSYDKSADVVWDYAKESPLEDARGFRREGDEIRFSRKENYRINNILENGARFYVDHAHPEYSTPECLSLYDLIACDRSGETIVEISCQRAQKKLPPDQEILIHKNNTDLKGNSYGCHENYLVDTPTYNRIFPKYPEKPEIAIKYLIPFFVTRQIYCGAGKVGSENGADSVEYQISQRADFFETIIDGNTTCNRPIINSRDEPHADRSRFRRLHIIIGDANMSEYSTFLKVGTTKIVLMMLEDSFIEEDLSLEEPVKSLIDISHDTSLQTKVRLVNQNRYTAIEIQKIFLETAKRYFETYPDLKTPEYEHVLSEWETVLKQLEDDPMQLKDRVDWVIKKWLMERQMRLKNFNWESARIKQMDIMYHDIRKNKGLFYILEADGHIKRINDPDGKYNAQYFIKNPPVDTRAYFRSQCLKRYGDSVTEANWDVIIFKNVNDKKQLIVPLVDPLKGTAEMVENLFKESADPGDLLEHLSG